MISLGRVNHLPVLMGSVALLICADYYLLLMKVGPYSRFVIIDRFIKKKLWKYNWVGTEIMAYAQVDDFALQFANAD